MQLAITNTGELRPVYIGPETLSCEEAWRVNRYLTDSQIEYLLDCAALVEKAGDRSALVDEALAQYPKEDFLQDVIGDLQIITKGMRDSDNKTALREIVESLEELQSEVGRATKYGREQLNNLEV